MWVQILHVPLISYVPLRKSPSLSLSFLNQKMEIIAPAFRHDRTLWRISLATLAENNCARRMLGSLENYYGGTRLRTGRK